MNTAFLKKLLDQQEREALKRLDCQVFISAEADEQWGFVGSKSNQRWLWRSAAAVYIRKTDKKSSSFCFRSKNRCNF